MWAVFRVPAWLLAMCLVFPSLAFAAEKPSDVRIIIDISGSMKENDPNNLRIPALKLLVEMLPEGSQAGVWTFGKYVNMLVPLDSVDDNWRRGARDKANAINSVGLRTNIGSALEKAAWKVKADSGFKHSVILLTDGMVDISKSSASNQKERQRILEKVVPRYREQGATIHTIALSDNADIDLLEQIALETKGMSAVAKSSEELLKIFVRAFDQAVPAEQLPLTDNSFQVDASVNEFTALIFRQDGTDPVRLMDPDGELYTAQSKPGNVKWFADKGYDLITVRSPKAGDWLVEAELDPENRVTIVSDMSLGMNDIPGNIFAGDVIELEAWLEEEGKVISKPEFLDLVDVELRVTAPGGRSGAKLLSNDRAPNDGIYRESLKKLRKKGDYQIRLRVEGKTFSRQRLMRVSLVEPIGVTQSEDAINGTRQVKVSANSPNIDTEASRVIAKIKGPDQHSIIQALPFNQDAAGWILDISPTKGDGEYAVSLNIKGKTKGGRTFKLSPEMLTLSFPVAQEAPAVVEPMIEEAVIEAEPVVEEPAVEPVKEEPVPEPIVAEEPEAPEEKIALPIPDLAEKLKQQEQIEVPDIEEESESNLLLYLGIGLANLVLLGAIITFVVMMIRKKRQQGPVAKDLAEAPVEELKPAVADVAMPEEVADDIVDIGSDMGASMGDGPGDDLVEQLMEEEADTELDAEVSFEEEPNEDDLGDFDQAFDLNETDDVPEVEIAVDEPAVEEAVEEPAAEPVAEEPEAVEIPEEVAEEPAPSMDADEEMPDLDELLSDLDFDDEDDDKPVE